MVGHASDETEDGMPFRRLTEVREPAKLCGLGPPPPPRGTLMQERARARLTLMKLWPSWHGQQRSFMFGYASDSASKGFMHDVDAEDVVAPNRARDGGVIAQRWCGRGIPGGILLGGAVTMLAAGAEPAWHSATWLLAPPR